MVDKKVNSYFMNKFSIMVWNIKGGASILWDKNIKSEMDVIKDIIIDRNKDIVILTEFVLYKGIDELFNELEKEYYYFISATTCYNGILIALKKEKFIINSEEIFNSEKIVINNNVGSIDAADFLEIYIKDYNLYIIGTRIRIKINPQNKNAKAEYKEKQIIALRNYIEDKINKDKKAKFVIAGDFNMNCNFLKKYLNNDSKFIINANNIDESIYSYVFKFTNNKILLDHIITINLVASSNFCCDNWKFKKNNIKCSDHDIIYQDIIV